MEIDGKENLSVYDGKTESTTDNHPLPPPAYTLEPTQNTSMYVGAGPIFSGVSSGVVMGPGVDMNPYHHHMGPPVVQHHHNGMVTTVAGGVVITSFTSKPARITCKSCQADVQTRCERKVALKTHFFAAALCLVCCIPCAIGTYFINECKNADHYCPECNAYIGSYVI